MKTILKELYNHKRLTRQQTKEIFIRISNEEFNAAQIASFISVFLMRPIASNELAGFRDALRELSVKVNLSEFNTIDLCGTGGDGKNTFNISTLTSFIVAGTGNKVAKHGNYSVSSKSGSSNMLEFLGYEFTTDETTLKQQLADANICFLHAPLFHPAMKVVAPIRRELGVKTFFNMLGPLVNPSSPQNQLVGVYSLEVARLYSYVLQETEANYGIVFSNDGYDEISLTSNFKLINREAERTISPEELGLKRIAQQEIYGGNSVPEAAEIFKAILNGKGTEAQNNVVLTNAAFALKTLDATKSFKEAFQEAEESLFGLKANSCLIKITR